MWWQYILVFLGALLFDIVPFPFPPAFTVMIFLQILFDLDVWTVIFVGVAGSVFGRYIFASLGSFDFKKIFESRKKRGHSVSRRKNE